MYFSRLSVIKFFEKMELIKITNFLLYHMKIKINMIFNENCANREKRLKIY